MEALNKNSVMESTIDFRDKKAVGKLGEDIACAFLKKNGFKVIGRNYMKKWGEIDIITVKDNALTFIEVKSAIEINSHIHGRRSPSALGGFRPEENVHFQKRRRLARTIQSYLAETRYGSQKGFLFHIITVRMDIQTRRAHVNLMENIIL